jgi:ABC-type branched-subunit amino acid transport system substrate-binding protein
MDVHLSHGRAAMPSTKIDDDVHVNARASIASVVVASIAITINHLPVLGVRAFALGGLLIGLSLSLMLHYRARRRWPALVGYLLVSTWIVLGFGLYKGLWQGALPLYLGTFLASLSTSYPRPLLHGYAAELSGVIMSIAAAFVCVFGIRLARAARARARGVAAEKPSMRAHATVAGVVAVASAAVVAAFVSQARDRWVEPEAGVVRIGVLVPTSGPYALLGGSFVKAVEMARDDLRGTKYRYELVIRDPGPDPRKARRVIEDVVDHDRVDALLGGISLIGQVTKPVAAAARIAHTCVCTVASIGDGAYNFTNIPSPEAEGKRWVEEARRRGIHRVAVISQDYPSINNHVKAMEEAAGREEIAIASDRRFAEGTPSFGAMIADARATRPDVYYIEALPPLLDQLAAELHAAGVHEISSVVAPSLAERPEVFEGAWYTDSNLRDPRFKERFERRYPGVRFATHMMPYAYDSLKMLVDAFEHGENPAVHLRNLTSYEGTADRLTKEPGSGNFQSRPAVWVMRGGKPTLEN